MDLFCSIAQYAGYAALNLLWVRACINSARR